MAKLIEALGTALSIGIIIFCLYYYGMNNNFIAPDGAWVCEELGITIDFDDNVKKSGGLVRGTIAIGEEMKEIACATSYMGDCEFYFIEDARDFLNSEKCFLSGGIANRGKDKLIFYGKEKNYTFVRQEIAGTGK